MNILKYLMHCFNSFTVQLKESPTHDFRPVVISSFNSFTVQLKDDTKILDSENIA